jgi:hypothetical protein
LTASISEYDSQPSCPKCEKKEHVCRSYEDDLPLVSVIKGDSEITLGHLAERNGRRFSEDKKQSIQAKHYDQKQKEDARKVLDEQLPAGMSRIQTPKTKIKWTKD